MLFLLCVFFPLFFSQVVLLPYSYRVLGSILILDYSLRGVANALHMSTWVSSGFSGFLTPLKNMSDG